MISSKLPEIAVGERALICGKTGCGKSYLAMKLTENLHRKQQVIIVDSKAELRLITKDSVIVTNTRTIHKQERVPIYYQAPIGTSQEELDDFFAWIYERRRTGVMIDEMFALGNGMTFPAHLRALYTRGRSRQITVIACTQRPFRVPLEAITESEHLCIFPLHMRQDRLRVQEAIPGSEEILLPQNYPEEFSFVYYNNKTGQSPEYRKVK